MARNPFATSHSFMAAVRSSFEVSRDTTRPSDVRPLRVAFSVGNGRGNARPEMTDEEFSALVGFLCENAEVSFSLSSVVAGSFTPAEIAARTLEVTDEGVCFRVSDAKGARTVKVPRDQWGSFTGFLTSARDVLPQERDLIWPSDEEREPEKAE